MIDRYIGKITDKQSIRQKNKLTDRQTDRQIDTGRQADTHKIKKQIDLPTDDYTGRQLNKLTTRGRISKRTNKPTDRN